jgi:hypothetical protein
MPSVSSRAPHRCRTAVRDVARRLDTDDDCAEVTITYIREVVHDSTGEVIAAIDR